MQPLTLQRIAEATHGVVHPATAGGVRVAGVCTDSRRLGPGQLFVALRGERFDGHDFLGDPVLASTAAAVLVCAGSPGGIPAGMPSVHVRDTRTALADLAAAHRSGLGIPLVCVAGSNGKTTTKELLAAVLSTRFRTLRSEASFNNDIGVPLSLLAVDASHEVAVLEAGTNHPGELAPLVRLISPHIGVVPQIGREHLEHFGDVEGVLEEESALARALPGTGTLFLNGDCPAAARLAGRTPARVVRCGFGPGNDWSARLLGSDWEATRFGLTAPDPCWSGDYALGVPGRHMVSNAILALAVAASMGVDPEAAREALRGFRGARQRLQWSERRGVRWLGDTYNANADSTLASLRTLADLPCEGRRIAVIGDMAELGGHTAEAHREVGAEARRLGIDLLVCVGRQAAHTASGAGDSGRVLCFPDVESAVPALRPMIHPGDCLLAKASRSSRIERLIESLAVEPSGTHIPD
ncbi:MAG: UDP-N-acetylmuramoyl-tripeptide--D-alanyl-D-alanine ligase [Verrucomicrobiota bacterium]